MSSHLLTAQKEHTGQKAGLRSKSGFRNLRPRLRQASTISRTEKTTQPPTTLERYYDKTLGHIQRKLSSRKSVYEYLLGYVKTYDAQFDQLTDTDFDNCVRELKIQLRQNGFTDDLLAQSFACIREASYRSVGMKHFDAQILGGLALFHGTVAEMQTGEGKTLTAVLAAASAGLAGIPTHVITVNDYLAERDALEMTPVYARLGLSVGNIIQGMEIPARQHAYACDVTYCTNNELVFDYLKDSIELKGVDSEISRHSSLLKGQRHFTQKLMLRGLHFAVVDEADSVLLDEARTPLVISGEEPPLEREQQMYKEAMSIAQRLEEDEHYIVQKARKGIEILPEGEVLIDEICHDLGDYWQGRVRRLELINKALIAIHNFIRDHHYLIQDGKVMIIDEHTGRLMPDRSWEQGLHQLIEIKEGCELSNPRKTLAKISYQRFFSLYHHLSGMTGTAREVTRELWEIYKLPVVKIPTNRPSLRLDKGRRVVYSSNDQWHALCDSVRKLREEGRPVLIGTVSVAQSESLSEELTAQHLPHQLLSAKYDSEEAEIVAQAGTSGKITVATSMAGRGTDIKLSPEVFEKGGLHVILASYNDASRIDRQLFGRCARQGDPGSYECLVSLEDISEDTISDSFLLGVIKQFWSKKTAQKLSEHLALWLLKRQQKRLEREHAYIRSQLLRADEKNEDLLAFSSNRI